jgi:hypothetical protein
VFETEEQLQEFFADYAAGRGLSGPADSGALDIGCTPLLGRGERNWWNHVMTGELPGGLQGVLGRYTFEWHNTDNDGHRELHKWATVAAVGRAPYAIGWPHIYCHRHTLGGGSVIDSVDTEVAEKTRRIKTESAAMDDRYDIRIPPGADETGVRRLFDPVLIDRLSTNAPEGFAFEIYDGVVAGWSTEVEDVAEQLDRLCETTSFVAERIDAESRQSAPPSVPASMADLLAHGRPGRATVVATFEIDEKTADRDAIVGFVLDVTPDSGDAAFQARVGNRTPADMLARALPGAAFPVRYDPSERAKVAIDWAAVRG